MVLLFCQLRGADHIFASHSCMGDMTKILLFERHANGNEDTTIFQHQEENNYEKQETGNLNNGCLYDHRSGGWMRRKERRYCNTG